MYRPLLMLTAFALVAPWSAAPVAAKDQITDAQALSVALADPRRDEDRVRDQYRHPAETLAFCEVKPGQTVIDYMPYSGWYTRILVPYLGENGRYIGLQPDVRNASEYTEYMRKNYSNMNATFPAKAAAWTGVPVERIAAYNTDSLPKELNGKVDRVLMMRELHNIWRTGLLHRELVALRGLLTEDGLLCIEQHRAKPDAPAAYTEGNQGYMREKDVIALVEAHGFQLAGKSEINANKKDPANHPKGVWMLPPNLQGSEKDEALRARMLEIGESDRMTLVFKKRP
jgi:predicted methyltransferase